VVCYGISDFTTLHNRLAKFLQPSIWQTRSADNKGGNAGHLYAGKLRLECRNGAPKIFARPYVQADWYLELLDRLRRDERLRMPW
jgi:hypothetical protein